MSSMVGKAKLLGSSNSEVVEAAHLLKEGRLVAFPTETVYGLGANAFDEKAVRSIFLAKGRPLTDPLIVHVPSIEDAKRMVNLNPEEMKIFTLLGRRLWPGPATLIVKAVDLLPLCVTADTGYVGIRVPNHSLALRLLRACQLPIAAPSANRFGHVSPTKAKHVLDDLGVDRGVAAVVSGDDADERGDGEQVDIAAKGTCEHGIESTVMKLDFASRQVLVFRQGAVSTSQIEDILKEHAEAEAADEITRWTVRVVSRNVHMVAETSSAAHSATSAEDSVAKCDAQEAPGQAITHYAPDNAVCIMSNSVDLSRVMGSAAGESPGATLLDADMLVQQSAPNSLIPWELSLHDLKQTVVIDFNGQWLKMLKTLRESMIANSSSEAEGPADFSDLILAYRDLSPTGSFDEAAFRLFDTLRWAELVASAVHIVVSPILQEMEVKTASSSGVILPGNVESRGIAHGVHDRLFRSTSGKMVALMLKR